MISHLKRSLGLFVETGDVDHVLDLVRIVWFYVRRAHE